MLLHQVESFCADGTVPVSDARSDWLTAPAVLEKCSMQGRMEMIKVL